MRIFLPNLNSQLEMGEISLHNFLPTPLRILLLWNCREYLQAKCNLRLGKFFIQTTHILRVFIVAETNGDDCIGVKNNGLWGMEGMCGESRQNQFSVGSTRGGNLKLQLLCLMSFVQKGNIIRRPILDFCLSSIRCHWPFLKKDNAHWPCLLREDRTMNSM